MRKLLYSGTHVRVLVRRPAMATAFASLAAEVFTGDVTDRDAVRQAVEGVATVYHLAGKLLVPGVPESEYRRTHVAGTAAVLDACSREPGLQRLVHCSTTGVLGVTGDKPADERTPFRPTNIYESTKAQAEWLVRRAIGDGLPAVIVRPGLVYGPGDLHLLGFFRSVLRRQFRPIGRKPVWLHPIYIDDITDALARCGRHPFAVGRCFHIAGQPVTLSELAATIAGAAGLTPAPGYIPTPVARAVAIFGDMLPGGLKRSAPLTTSRLDFLTHSRVYSVDGARYVLDFAAQTGLAEGIARTLQWYRANGHLPAPDVAKRPEVGAVGSPW